MAGKKLGIIGARGMVGQVLLKRMVEENDFAPFETTFFSTSSIDQPNPYVTQINNANVDDLLRDAFDLNRLLKMDYIISTQGGDYTSKIFKPLMEAGYKGKWIDAASTLRMHADSVIVLDPINLEQMKQSLHRGGQIFVGGNCTVSLMLLALGGLFKENLVEWVSSMTYQAASGAGARNMAELLVQSHHLTRKLVGKVGNNDNWNPQEEIENLSRDILKNEEALRAALKESDFPKDHFGAPLSMNLLPFIDSEWEHGQSKEEWKGAVEANKILQTAQFIPVDGTCVRVGALRSHSQALTIKLHKNVSLKTCEELVKSHNSWVKFVPNQKSLTMSELTPAATSGTLNIAVGRMRKMNLGDTYLNVFTVGDQLLWGAAEPLRRTLQIMLENEK